MSYASIIVIIILGQGIHHIYLDKWKIATVNAVINILFI